MPQPSTSGKRGRPPGTGKNDTDRLFKIAALMAADPALKPTTAIKQIGETDPSTIRRLRDKFHEQQALLGTAPTIATSPVTASVAEPALPHFQNRPAAMAQHVAPIVVSSPKQTMLAATVVTPVPAMIRTPAAAAVPQTVKAEIDFEPLFKPAPVQDPFMVFGKWFGNGIETAAVLFEQQMLFAQSMLKATPMKAMWRQQIVATEYLLMLSGPGQRISAPSQHKSA
jgi:hypothetical protein